MVKGRLRGRAYYAQRGNKYRSVSYCRHSQQYDSMSSLTSLSWAPNTSFLHDIHVTSTRAKASPSTTGQSYLSCLEIKIEKLRGYVASNVASNVVFSFLYPPSLKTSTVPSQLAYICFLCLLGREPRVPLPRQRVRQGLTAALLLVIKFPRVPFWECGVD